MGRGGGLGEGTESWRVSVGPAWTAVGVASPLVRVAGGTMVGEALRAPSPAAALDSSDFASCTRLRCLRQRRAWPAPVAVT